MLFLHHDVTPKPASHTVTELLRHLDLLVWLWNNIPLLLHGLVCTVKNQNNINLHSLPIVLYALIKPSFGVENEYVSNRTPKGRSYRY
jgi:hypothetical protein